MRVSRYLNILILVLVFSFSMQAQTEGSIELLKTAYVKATKNADSLDFQKQYFDAFPKTFVTFRNTFSYFENKDPRQSYAGPLSAESERYISLFFRLKNVPDAEFYTKLINLGIGALWYSDAETHLQAGLRKKVFQNPQITFELLKNETDRDVESFWFFFLGGQHEPYKTIPEKLKEHKPGNETIYGLLEKALQASLNHGH